MDMEYSSEVASTEFQSHAIGLLEITVEDTCAKAMNNKTSPRTTGHKVNMLKPSWYSRVMFHSNFLTN